MSIIHIATYESRNFTFQAVGLTAAEARAALVRALDAHRDQYKLTRDWRSGDDLHIEALEVGAGYRDHSRITAPPATQS